MKTFKGSGEKLACRRVSQKDAPHFGERPKMGAPLSAAKKMIPPQGVGVRLRRIFSTLSDTPIFHHPLKTNSARETKELAKGWADTLKPGDILALVGELGSGKTCFVQGLASGLGIPETVPVASPTFVLIHEYRGGRCPLFHFDFYRLEKVGEAKNLNLEEYWDGEGISVIEWADKFAGLFPKRTQWIHFEFVEKNIRRIKFLY